MKYLLTFLVLGFGFSHANATHFSGGQITWKYLHADTLLVTLTALRDCKGIHEGGGKLTYQIGNISGKKSKESGPSPYIDITPVCAGTQCSSCDRANCTFGYGIATRTFRYIFPLNKLRKTGKCELNLRYEACCRSSYISTGPNNDGFSLDAMVNLCDSTYNNSPEYDPSDLFRIFCIGDDVSVSNIPFGLEKDSLGRVIDSLSFKWDSCLSQNGKSVTYSRFYTYNKPIDYLAFPRDNLKLPRGLHLDSLSGLIRFRAMQVQQTIFKIRCEEYRDTTLVGVVGREYYAVVMKCPSNNPPVIGPIRSSTKLRLQEQLFATVCAGDSFNMSWPTQDLDTMDTIAVLAWTSTIDSAKLSIDSTNRREPILNFTWKSSIADISSKKNFVSATITDNNCPVMPIVTKTYVIQTAPSFHPKTTYTFGACGKFQGIIAHPDTSQKIKSFKWKIQGVEYNNDTVSHKFSRPGKHIITCKMSGDDICNKTFKDTITISSFTPLRGRIKNQLSCYGKTLTVKPDIDTSYGGPIFIGLPNINRFDTNEIKLPRRKEEDLEYTLSDTQGCVVRGVFDVVVDPNPKIDLTDKITRCIEDSMVKLSPLNLNKTAGTWNGDGIRGDTLLFESPGRKFAHFKVEGSQSVDSTSCTYYDSVAIEVGEGPETFLPADTSYCELEGMLLPRPFNGTWIGDSVYRLGKNYFLDMGKDSLRTLTYESKSADLCKSVDTVRFRKLRQILPIYSGPEQSCPNANTFFELKSNPQAQSWKGDGVIIYNEKPYFNRDSVVNEAFSQIEIEFTYITPQSGCEKKNAIWIDYQKELRDINLGSDTSLCISEDSFRLKYNNNGKNTWFGTAVSTRRGAAYFNATAAGRGEYYITLEALNSYFKCPVYDSQFIQVDTFANLLPPDPDSICVSDPAFQIIMKPMGGTWSGNGIVPNSRDTFNPKLANLGNANVLEYTYTQGACTNYTQTEYYVYGPRVRFGVDTTEGNAPLTVNFNSNRTLSGANFKWFFDDENQSSSTSRNTSFTYRKEGAYSPSLIVEDNNGCSDTLTKQDLIVVGSSSLSNPQYLSVEIYPNPTTGQVFIENYEAVTGIKLYDNTMKFIKSFESKSSLNIGQYPSGTYFLLLNTKEAQEQVFKIIKE